MITWFEEIQTLELSDDCASLRQLYKVVGDFCYAGKFEEVNKLLTEAATDNISTKLLLGLLTITLRFHDKFPARPAFYDRIVITFDKRGLADPRILGGLG